VNGHAFTQSFTVREDPRVKASQADLEKQYRLARQIEAQHAQIAQASKQVVELLKQIAALQARAPDAVAKQLAAFAADVTRLTELHAVPVPYGTPGSSPTDVTSLAYIGDSLGTLQRAVESADTAPTADAVTGFRKQSRAAQAALAAWSRFESERLPTMNKALEQAGLTPMKL
jgi:hypothetical protein